MSIPVSPYLRVQRTFPQESQALSVELSKSYVDIAGAVNDRTIGIFPSNGPLATGERWFLNGQNGRQQSLRQVYAFSGIGSYDHGISVSTIFGFTRIFGTFTNGTNWYPLPYVDVVSATNQIGLSVTPTQIVIAAGSGSPPSVTSGLVVLEWLSLP